MLIWLIGGSGGAILNGGVYNPDTVPTGYTDAVADSNGTPLATVGAADSIDNDGGNLRIIKAAAFGAAVQGVWAYCTLTGPIASDRYEILSETANSITIDEPYQGGVACTGVVLGGSIHSPGDGDITCVNDAFADAAGDDIVKMISNIPCALGFSSSGIFDFLGGTAGAWITIEGVNSTTGVRLTAGDTNPAFIATAAKTRFYKGEFSWIQWHCIDFNANSNLTSYVCQSFTGRPQYYNLCRFYNHTGTAAFYTASYNVLFTNCEFFDNTNIGLYMPFAYNAAIGCSFHGNGTGVSLALGTVAYCHIYNNGIGIASSGDSGAIIGNVIDKNTSHGINMWTGHEYYRILNNQITNNGGWGINWGDAVNGWLSQDAITNNNGYNNTSGESSGGTWATLDQANNPNFSFDPLYMDDGDDQEDYRTRDRRALAGLPEFQIVNGDTAAVALKIPIGVAHKIPSAKLIGRGLN